MCFIILLSKRLSNFLLESYIAPFICYCCVFVLKSVYSHNLLSIPNYARLPLHSAHHACKSGGKLWGDYVINFCSFPFTLQLNFPNRAILQIALQLSIASSQIIASNLTFSVTTIFSCFQLCNSVFTYSTYLGLLETLSSSACLKFRSYQSLYYVSLDNQIELNSASVSTNWFLQNLICAFFWV